MCPCCALRGTPTPGCCTSLAIVAVPDVPYLLLLLYPCGSAFVLGSSVCALLQRHKMLVPGPCWFRGAVVLLIHFSCYSCYLPVMYTFTLEWTCTAGTVAANDSQRCMAAEQVNSASMCCARNGVCICVRVVLSLFGFVTERNICWRIRSSASLSLCVYSAVSGHSPAA